MLRDLTHEGGAVAAALGPDEEPGPAAESHVDRARLAAVQGKGKLGLRRICAPEPISLHKNHLHHEMIL